jgi:hypothetical protein
MDVDDSGYRGTSTIVELTVTGADAMLQHAGGEDQQREVISVCLVMTTVARIKLILN